MTDQPDIAIRQFFQSTYTQADARRRMTLLETVLEQIVYAKGQGKTIDILVQEYAKTPEDKTAVGMFLRSNSIPTDPTAIRDFLVLLRDSLLRLPTVTLSLPFEPSPDQVVAYGKWFRTNVSTDTMLSLLMDASVVGGCSITWQGRKITYDLEYLMKQKRNDIIAVVDKYVDIKKKEKVI